MKNFLKNYGSANIFGRCSDREDETSMFKMCSWNADAASAMVTNCRFLANLHDDTEVSNLVGSKTFMNCQNIIIMISNPNFALNIVFYRVFCMELTSESTLKAPFKENFVKF